jgi:hypothetical protein
VCDHYDLACPLTVISDSDAFILADGWNVRLMTLFLECQLSLFAANSRHSSHGEVFRDVDKWNLMTFRTQSFAAPVLGGSGSVALPDVGHYFTKRAKSMNAGYIHLQGVLWAYKGKAMTVVTDTDGAGVKAVCACAKDDVGPAFTLTVLTWREPILGKHLTRSSSNTVVAPYTYSDQAEPVV